MTTFSSTEDLEGARFVDANLRAVRFVECDLSGVVMRGVELGNAYLPLGGPLAKLVTASCAWTGLARIAQADANAANARGTMDDDARMPAPECGIRKPTSDEGGEPAL